jgi:hypothetical protein
MLDFFKLMAYTLIPIGPATDGEGVESGMGRPVGIMHRVVNFASEPTTS